MAWEQGYINTEGAGVLGEFLDTLEKGSWTGKGGMPTSLPSEFCQGQEQTQLLCTSENQIHYILYADKMKSYFENLFR